MNTSRLELKSIFVMVFVIIISTNTFSWWYANHTDTAFVSRSGEDGESYLIYFNSEPLESYVVDGAGFFLESYSTVLKVMKKIEWTHKDGVSNCELYNLLEKASLNMKYANENYQKLIAVANTSIYNFDIIEKLKKFDYDSFQKNYFLNSVVFEEVILYLRKGKVREVYEKIRSDTDTLSKMLDDVKLQVEANSFPSISAIWKLNQKFSQSLLFGQYLAQVFESILNE